MTFPAQEGSWEVHCSGIVAATIRRVQRQAKSEGRGEQAIRAMERIGWRLTMDPQHFGEPLYRLPALQMQVRHAVVRPLAVDFGV